MSHQRDRENGGRYTETDMFLVRLDEQTKSIEKLLTDMRTNMVTKSELQAAQETVRTDMAKLEGKLGAMEQRITPMRVLYFAIIGTIVTGLLGGGIAALFAAAK